MITPLLSAGPILEGEVAYCMDCYLKHGEAVRDMQP
jgi:hypothetical protein